MFCKDVCRHVKQSVDNNCPFRWGNERLITSESIVKKKKRLGKSEESGGDRVWKQSKNVRQVVVNIEGWNDTATTPFEIEGREE